MALDNLTPETRLEYYLDKIAENSGGGGASCVYNVEMTSDGAGNYTLSKNYREIEAAVTAGQIVQITLTELEFLTLYTVCRISTKEYRIDIFSPYNNDKEAWIFTASSETGTLTHTEVTPE